MRVDLSSVSKSFSGAQALRDVSLSIESGSIHALVGENGAGKSTLGKVIAGIVHPDAGDIALDGQPVAFRTPGEAIAAGVAVVHQELALVPYLTVADNVFLGGEGAGPWLRRGAIRRRFDALQQEWGFTLPADAPVGPLSVAQRQQVEILRAVARGARLIVMDEPTSSLSPDESARLHRLARDLRDRGTTIIYVSHFLEEVIELADRITVLRNGRLIRTEPAEGATPRSLAEAMLGREFGEFFPDKPPVRADAEVVLDVRGLTRAPAFADVSFQVRAGEIVGMAGLVGSGRSEVALAVYGADRAEAGTVELDGRPLELSSPRAAVARGLAMVPESRRDQGLVMQLPVAANITLAHLSECTAASVIRRGNERRTVREMIGSLGVMPANPSLPVSALSGGNQQKVLFAKWLMREPRVLLLDEPTRGVDIGAKRAIYELIAELASRGVAVLVISSELEELIGICHRAVVMRRGRLVAEFGADELQERTLLEACLGIAGPPALS